MLNEPLVVNEPLFGIHVVPVDWPVLRRNLRIVSGSPHGAQFLSELRSSFVRSSLFFGCLLVSCECSFILSATDLDVSQIYTVV